MLQIALCGCANYNSIIITWMCLWLFAFSSLLFSSWLAAHKYGTQVDIKKYGEGGREGGLKAVILFLSLREEDDDFMERCVWEGRIGLDFRVQLFFYLSFGFRRDHPLINVNQKHGKSFQSFCLSPILHFFYFLNLCFLNF